MKKNKPLQHPAANDPAMEPGGYHSHGTPGEEADLRKQMRVRKISDLSRTVNKARPVKGGGTAESTAAGRQNEAATGATLQPHGAREVYVVARKEAHHLETPVFEAGEKGEEEAVAIFTSREKALLYLQTARWQQTHEPVSLSPRDLGRWLREGKSEGIQLAVVDPDRQGHLGGEEQPVLLLNALVDQSDDNLYREVWALGRP